MEPSRLARFGPKDRLVVKTQGKVQSVVPIEHGLTTADSAHPDQWSAIGRALMRYGPVMRIAARHRWFLIVPAAVLAGVVTNPANVDLIRFARLGSYIFTGQLGRVYNSDWTQAGPLELLFTDELLPRPNEHIAAFYVRSEDNLVSAHLVVGALVMVVVLLLTRRLRNTLGLSRSPAIELAVGVAALMMGLSRFLWFGGHVAEFAIAIMWVWGGALALRGRPWAAAIVLGLSTAWEPWGILAAPLLLMEPDRRKLVGSSAVFGAAGAAPYLPFVATGHFRLFAHVWPIVTTSFVHLVWPAAQDFSWQMRLFEAGASCVAGALVVRLVGRRNDVLWLAPTAIMLVRLLLDPMNLPYYWTAVSVLMLAGLAMTDRRSSPTRVANVLALILVPHLLVQYSPFKPGSLYLFPVAFMGIAAAIHQAATMPQRNALTQHEPWQHHSEP